MKNAFFLSLALVLFGAAANAQSTVDSIKAKYQMQPMPEALTVEKSFPVLGSYQLTNADGTAQTVTVSLDPDSKGIVWVDGLPEGKFKAYLKQSPATYRIVAQKSSTDKQVGEGTLIFDPATNMLQVALGKKYDDANPASVFAANAAADVAASGTNEVKVKTKNGADKSKARIVFYQATKTDAATMSMNATQQ